MLPRDVQSLRKHLPAFGVFITPVLLVKFAAFSVSKPAPSTYVAHIQPASVQAPLSPPPNRKPTEAEVAGAKRIAELRTQRFGSSPLYYAGSAAVYVPQDPPVEEEPEALVDDALNVIIRAVLSSRDGASSIAIINGRQHRVGDVIAQWQIVAISTNDRTVTFEHTETGERESHAVLGP